MDIITLGLAKRHTNSVALNGVTVQHPRINPTTKHWEIFNPGINGYVDTGIRAEGVTPEIGTNGNWWLGPVDTGVMAELPSPDTLISNDVNNALVLGSDDRLFVPVGGQVQSECHTHIQNTASDTWTITHNLDRRYVSVQIIDSSGKTVWANIEYTNINTVTLGFTVPIVGVAIIRR